jgi:DNA-directed RNA polymerase specialized sigma24 family protein
MLGLPVNTVKTHLHRARARLAVALADTKENAA